MNVSALFPPFKLSASESLIPDCPSLIRPHPQEDWKRNELWNFWGADIPAGFLFPHSLAYLKCLQITAMGISRGYMGKAYMCSGISSGQLQHSDQIGKHFYGQRTKASDEDTIYETSCGFALHSNWIRMRGKGERCM